MKVIFSPYCNFATMGFSEMKLNKMSTVNPDQVDFLGSKDGHIREHPSLEGEWHRNDEEHE